MTENSSPPEHPLPPQQPRAYAWRLLKNVLRRVENFLFVLVLFLVALYFLLQLPVVQNWLVRKTTTYLSTELGTRVELKRLDIEFFDNIVLEGLYIEDLNGDTMLMAQKFSAGLSGNFFSVLWNRLEFSEISLTNANIHLRKMADQRRGNLNELLFRIGELFGSGPSKKKKKQSPFSVKIQNLNLHDVVFADERYSFREGEIRSRIMLYKVSEGNVKINNIDIGSNLVDVRSATFNGFQYAFKKDRQDPPPGFVPYIKPLPLKTDTLSFSEPLRIMVGQLSLQNSGFTFDNFRRSPNKQTPPEVMDYDHMAVSQIDGQAERLEIYIGEKAATDANGRPSSEDVFDLFGDIKHLTAREQCGFALAHGEARRLMLTDSITALYGARIETTGGSTFGDTLMFRYEDTPEDDPWLDLLGDFNNKVTMDIRLSKGSKIRLGDVRHFEETVYNNEFFTANKDLVADVSGLISGRVNGKLKADDFEILVGNSTRLRGEFDGRGLGDNDEPMVLNFDFEELLTDMSTIAKVVPGFRPPKQFLKLNRLSFIGSYQLFDGFDHVLYGKFVTSLGPGQIDMQLNLKDGPAKAIYRGDLKMRGFDMASWTGDRNFGPSTFQVNVAENSTGLTLPTVNARVTGKVDTFFYNRYPYRDIKLNGKFEKYVFDGKVESDDPNVDFVFDGNINFKDTIPVFDFTAKIRRLDLGVLHLVEPDWVLFGEIKQLKLRGRNVDEIVGTAELQNFKILEDRENWYSLDYLKFNSYFRPDGTRFFGFDSDVATGQMTGTFSIAKAPRNLLRLLGNYHPAFVEKLGLPANDSLPIFDRYDLNFQIRNSRNLAQLLVPGLDTLRNVKASASVDARRGTSYLVLEAPLIRFGDAEFRDPSLRWNSDGDSAWLYLRLPENWASKKSKLPAISLGGPLIGDVFHLKLEAKDEAPNSIVESVYLDGELSVMDSLWQLTFNASKIKLFSQEWLIEEENYIRFGSNYFETKQLELFNGIKRIALESKNNGRGLRFGLTNFDLSEANRFLNPEQIRLRGKAYDFEVSIRDVFLLQGIEVGFLADTVFVNEKPYGEMLSNFELPDLSKPLTGKIFLLDKNTQKQHLRVAGAYLMGNGEEGTESPIEGTDVVLKAGEFFAQLSADDLPFEVIETIVPEISKTAGRFNANLTATGDINHPMVEGAMMVKEGAFQIDYLKTLFHIKNQPITFTKNKISAEGDTIYDATRQHIALVYGGLEHDYFSKWRVNCRIESKDPGFLVLNTSASDSDLYYGRAEGSFEAKFSGSFSRTNIAIEATTGPGTRLFIPLSTSLDAKEINFINFSKDKPKPEELRKNKSFVSSDLKGLNFEMDMTVTDQAEIQLIFDEQTGDIIKGRGDGNIKLAINREGEFTMYGGYQIVRGEYLFTLLNFVNKPFVVTNGGTINWYGDPYGAQINLDATYELNTSVYNFVKEELELLRGARPQLLDEAAKATKVEVNMHLAGDLLKPNITFGLNFPNISSGLKSVTDTKLRLLRQDQAELSRQVFGLVVIGSFLPPSAGFSSNYVATAFNTLTQMISNQFSNYLAGLATEWFGGAVSSIDFDIVYSDYQNDVLADQNLLGGKEVNVRLSSGFINDRVTVQVGSQFGLGGTGITTSDGFLGEDVTVQIALTENRQWRLKVYQRTEPDISGRTSLRFGLGISFQKDYDTFEDMWKSFGRVFSNRRAR